MRIVLILFFFFTITVAVGQPNDCSQSVEGIILDRDTNEPLPFATIRILGTDLGTIADDEGRFKIENICTDEADLEVRFLGYKLLVHHHDFHHPAPTIYLASDGTLLESVVVEEKLNLHELKSLEPLEVEMSSLDGIGSNAGDILSGISGVSILKTGQNVVKPIVHGLHSSRVLIINNGVRHSYQAWGREHAPEIDPSQIERIQLIKGASTVRYGSDALGGVILFDSPTPAYLKDLNGSINGGFQSNGRSVTGELSLSEGYKRTAWMATISGTKQGDLEAPNYMLTNTGKQEFGYSVAGRFHLPWTDIDVYANHFDQNLAILRGSVNGNLTDLANAILSEPPPETQAFSYDIRNPKQETVHDLLKVKAAIFLGKNQFDVQYAYQQNQRREFDIRRGTNNDRPAINLTLISQSLDIDWDHPSNGTWEGTIGLQLLTQNNDNIAGTNTIPFVPNYDTRSIGLFAIESFSAGKSTYEAGIRLDLLTMDIRGRDSQNDVYRDDLSYENFTFTLGFNREISSTVNLRSNLGTAWRAPNVNELYSFGKHQSIIEFGIWRYEIDPSDGTIVTDEVLTNSQKEVKSEGGLKWISTLSITKPSIVMEATPYINFIQNYFFLRPYGLTNTIRGTFPFFIHDQTDALYKGVDVDIRKTWDETTSSELKISYVSAKDISNDQFFVGIPPLNIQASIRKQYGKMSVEVTPEWNARQNQTPPTLSPESFIDATEITFDRSGTFDFTDAPKGFFLLNASVHYQSEKLDLRLQADNILNQGYRRYTDQMRYFADDLGINLGIFVGYKF